MSKTKQVAAVLKLNPHALSMAVQNSLCEQAASLAEIAQDYAEAAGERQKLLVSTLKKIGAASRGALKAAQAVYYAEAKRLEQGNAAKMMWSRCFAELGWEPLKAASNGNTKTAKAQAKAEANTPEAKVEALKDNVITGNFRAQASTMQKLLAAFVSANEKELNKSELDILASAIALCRAKSA
jgi:hypothetical protein